MNNRLSVSILVAVLVALLFRLPTDAGFSLDTLAAFHRPGAGATRALPAEVLDATRAINALGLREVRFAGRFAPEADMYLHQRLAEYLYPVRIAPDAAHAVVLTGDALPAPTCRVIVEQGLARVARCE